MKKILKKTPFGLSLTYSNGGYFHNLSGRNATLTLVPGGPTTLSIDLSGNLQVRNKAVNCYADALELAEQFAELKEIEIHDQAVTDAVEETGASWWAVEQEDGTYKDEEEKGAKYKEVTQLELSLGPAKGILRFEATFQSSVGDKVCLDVRAVAIA